MKPFHVNRKQFYVTWNNVVLVRWKKPAPKQAQAKPMPGSDMLMNYPQGGTDILMN